MTQNAPTFTWGITFTWPLSWPLFRFWRVAGNVPAELAANKKALEAAHMRLSTVRRVVEP